jgi:hypothetical protein
MRLGQRATGQEFGGFHRAAGRAPRRARP